MSLQFIIGPSGSGKTTKMQENILNEAINHPETTYIILVPEQYNMQTQVEIVKKSPNKGIMNIDVQSFMRLSHRIFDEAGGNDRTLLDDTGKSMIIRRVSSSLNDELKVLSGHLDKAGYINEIKSVISEFLQYDIYPDDLEKMRQNNNDRLVLGEKLNDLKKIYEAFIDYLGKGFITNEEILDRATALSDKAAFLKDCEVYLDGYTGFTPVQIRFLGNLMKRCKKVTVTITMGQEEFNGKNIDIPSKFSDEELFAINKKTIYLLTSMAKASKIDVLENMTIVSNYPVRLKDTIQLQYMERHIFRKNSELAPYAGSKEDILIISSQDMRSEVRAIGRLIAGLIRNEGYKYSDIAILTGDLEKYRPILMTELVKYNVPFFLDLRHDILLNPCTELMMSILEIVIHDFNYDSVFRFLKSGMVDFTESEIDDLDNYVIAAGINRKQKYIKEWTYVPKGYREEDLLYLNTLREKLINNLIDIIEKIPQRKAMKASEYVRVIYEYVRRNGIYGKILALSKEHGENNDKVREDEYRQIYERLITVFDRVMDLMPDELVTADQFKDIIEAGLFELSVGVLPPGIDQVIIGDLERTRLSEVKALILMGANDGCIPRDTRKNGILSEIDRQILKDQNVELSPGTREQAFIQKFYLYMYMTKPSNKLIITYPNVGADNKPVLPSYLIDTLDNLFGKIKRVAYDNAPDFDNLISKEEGFDLISAGLNQDGSVEDEKYNELFRYYACDTLYRDDLLKIINNTYRTYENNPIESSVARALYGDTIKGSVSRIEKFASCAFAHFISYGLRLSEKAEYSFQASDLGNIYHDVLMEYSNEITESEYGWTQISPEKSTEFLDEAINKVLIKQNKGVLFDTKRQLHLQTRIKRVLERTISVLLKQIRSGDFIPHEYELFFSEDSDIGGIDSNITDDIKMHLVGRIDRLDTYEADGVQYVRVVDYKSGKNSLDPILMEAGVQLQLPVYLGQGCKVMGKKNKGLQQKMAGMFYYHIDDPVLDRKDIKSLDDIEEVRFKKLSMDGLVNSDLDVIYHMDKNIESSSSVVPVGITKNGTLTKKSKAMSEEELNELVEQASDKLKELGRSMVEGDVSVRPYCKGDRSACTYCRYGNMCGFDENIPGYEYNKLEDGVKEEDKEQ